MDPLFADLAIPVAVDTLFTYSVPPALRPHIRRGMRAAVQLGRRSVTGFVVELKSSSSVPGIKPIRELLDAEPVISDELLALTKWMAEYYFAPWGEVLKGVLVQGSVNPARRMVSAAAPFALTAENLSRAETSILAYLGERGATAVGKLSRAVGIKGIAAPLSRLAARGAVTIAEEFAGPKAKFERAIAAEAADRLRWNAWKDAGGASGRGKERKNLAVDRLLALDGGDPSVAVGDFLRSTRLPLSVVRSLTEAGLLRVVSREVRRDGGPEEIEPPPAIRLNPDQEAALGAVVPAIEAGSYRSFLLHGVTGSGKTQVYIEAIRAALALGKSAIVLVPEIALTPQIVRRFKARFGEAVTVMHSRMSVGERYDAWRAAWEGRCSVVIGPRSALFAPLRKIGLIVVDEEHESSYKQFEHAPRYHARDAALVRGRGCNAVVILGSATPSLESYANAVAGKHTLLSLPVRADDAAMPCVGIVDMKAEREKRYAEFRIKAREARAAGNPAGAPQHFEHGALSTILEEKISDRLAKREGIIILQNRRGFAPYIECPACGYVAMCANCRISLTLHLAAGQLRCHYCGSVCAVPASCPACGFAALSRRGFGTQRVEEELGKAFPSARILRMDLDTTTRRGAHDAILGRFGRGDADILLGTQMVAKGLDFARVTLVGVISADTQMLLPDFRSAERTFQLLTQVAGRAGRSALAGEVVIQTLQPGHYALAHVLTHDYLSFYNEESTYRRELLYPPYARLALLEFAGASEEEVIGETAALAAALNKGAREIIVLGPAAAALPRLRGEYRWQVLLKSPRESDPGGAKMQALLKGALAARARAQRAPAGKRPRVRLTIDVDPVGMM